jgi:DNA-directed RNA polymerase specialized sigma24 family protein
MEIEELIKKHDSLGVAVKYFIENKTIKEISEETKINYSTVQKTLQKIREKIKKEL